MRVTRIQVVVDDVRQMVSGQPQRAWSLLFRMDHVVTVVVEKLSSPRIASV